MPSTDKAPWLQAGGLCFSHGPRRVVDDLSLALFPGRHYVLAGPNGAGKSTVLDLLSGLRKPERGLVSLMGQVMDSYGAGKLAKLVALAPQNQAFGFAFTVREAVRLGRRPHLGRWGRLGPEDHRAVGEAIERMHLELLADKPVTSLSGGEAQRVVLARTMAQATPILLLDEPSSNLDVAQALDLMATLAELAQNGSLVVTVSHDLGLAATFAHEMALMRDGRLVAAGPKEEILTPALLEKVFAAEAAVRPDDFTGGLALSFRRPKAGGHSVFPDPSAGKAAGQSD
ncbi:MAG: ABC transporter ATP-binding protein [Deltaproteobacteria bacterium]|nr:ABC transporter ATP-binding protein [Deltaproteobacteria bacterium]